MGVKITETEKVTVEKEVKVEKNDKTPAEKAWDTRRKNEIDNLNEQLDKSIPQAAHKQWMKKKIMKLLKRMQKLQNSRLSWLEKNNNN